MNISEVVLSPYAESLPQPDNDKYKAKMHLINSPDPYTIPDIFWKRGKDTVEKVLPPLKREELIFHPTEKHSESGKKMEAFKNLIDGKQYIKNGWVSCFQAFPLLDGNVIIKAKVCHSQPLSLPPLVPWIVLAKNAVSVIAAHCTCVAGYN